jgi:hypothetical protein
VPKGGVLHKPSTDVPQEALAKPDHHIYWVEYRRISRSRLRKKQLQDGVIKKLAMSNQAVGMQGRADEPHIDNGPFRVASRPIGILDYIHVASGSLQSKSQSESWDFRYKETLST